jgi:hypothetical protein
LLGLTDEEIEQRFAGSPDRGVRPEGANHVGEMLRPGNNDPWPDVRDTLNSVLSGWSN